VPEPCGDLALTHGGTPPGRARLGASWRELVGEGGWTVWATAPTPGWRGYGLTRFEEADGLELTLGRRPDHWLSLRWDRASARWSARTDRFGTLQAYVAPGIVTTYSPAAWGPGPTLDWTAIAGFLRLGWYPGDRMPVAGVRLLRPATELRLDAAGGEAGTSRWQGWMHDPTSPASAEHAADRVMAVVTDVLDEQVDEDLVALPISGGLDSRLTVARLTRDGGPVARERLAAFSYGYRDDSPELRIAGEVGAARGLAVRTSAVGPYLFDGLDRVVGATEGLVDLTLTRQASVADDLAHCGAVVAAHWGDVWFGAPTPAPGVGPADGLLAAATKRGHAWLTEHVVRPHLGHDPEDDLRDLLATEAAALAHLDDPVVHRLALKTEQWSLRWTEASLRAHQAAAPPRLPFYDPRVADAVLTLPGDLLTGRRLQIDHLRRHDPDLARIEWQAVETDLFGLRHERTWRLPRRAARRAWRRLRPPPGPHRNWEVQLGGPEGRAGVDRWLLEEGAAIHELVARQAVHELVAAQRARPDDPERGEAVSRLLTLAVWKARFA
jgi:hypothetical protein